MRVSTVLLDDGNSFDVAHASDSAAHAENAAMPEFYSDVSDLCQTDRILWEVGVGVRRVGGRVGGWGGGGGGVGRGRGVEGRGRGEGGGVVAGG